MEESKAARERFGNAKSISSAQYFGEETSRENDQEVKLLFLFLKTKYKYFFYRGENACPDFKEPLPYLAQRTLIEMRKQVTMRAPPTRCTFLIKIISLFLDLSGGEIARRIAMSATSDIGSIKDALVDGSKKVCSRLRGRMRINNSLSLAR